METQNTENGYSSSEDSIASVASTSSLGSIRSVGTDGIINQLIITSSVEVNPLKSLNKELSDKMELLENQNIPELESINL